MKVSFALDDDIRKFYDADTTKHVLLQKTNLMRDLESWLHAALLGLGHITKKQRAIHRVLEARWLTCKIWINTGLERRITDESQDGTFKQIVDIALQIAGPDSDTSSDVLAGAGFIPVLHFLAMKSQNIEIQLAGLLLFKEHCHLLNTMWDSKLLYLGAKRAIELDHGVVIKSDWPETEALENLMGATKTQSTPIFNRALFVYPWVEVCMNVCEKVQEAKLLAMSNIE
ncbi:C6 zinc finger domain protein [Penicillium malachiteum]|nr:C6 zinc finger domain protein [Penicillium malachiteum]